MRTKIKNMKSELKLLAQQIKTQKPEYRQTQSTYDKSSREYEITYGSRKGTKYNAKDHEIGQKADTLKSSVESARHEFRHKHIAYCLLRGRSLQQIESAGNRCDLTIQKGHRCGCSCPNMSYIEQLMKEEIEDETVCSGEGRPAEEPSSSPSGTCISAAAPVGSSIKDEQSVEQSDSDLSEGTRLGFFDAVKSLFR